MKKRLIFYICLIIILANTFVYFGAVSCSKYTEPWFYENVIWYSDNPEIEVFTENGSDLSGYCMVDGVKVEVEMVWGFTYSYDMLKKGYDVISDETVLLSGKIEFDENTVTLKIRTDNLFDNKYDEIILCRRSA